MSAMMFCVNILPVFVLVVIAILQVIVSSESTLIPRTKIIVDTDAGTDDAMALFILLQAENHLSVENNERTPEIIAITTVNGNTYIDNVCINVLKVLKLSNRLDIPVYKGSHGSLLDTPEIDDYFGKDGLGDVEFPMETPDMSLLQNEHAVHALVNLVNKYPGEIEVLVLGPLTNIALAVRLDKLFITKLKKLVILGGSSEGKGNKAPGVEFNFYMDPEANYIVLNGGNYTDEKIDLLSWENAERVYIPLSWRKNILGAVNSTIMQFLNTAEHLDTNTDDDDEPWFFVDPLAAMYILHPDLSQKIHSFHAIAVTQGVTRGGLVLDYYDTIKTEPKINIVKNIDTERHKSLLIKYLT